jgi:hypothetical protein
MPTGPVHAPHNVAIAAPNRAARRPALECTLPSVPDAVNRVLKFLSGPSRTGEPVRGGAAGLRVLDAAM